MQTQRTPHSRPRPPRACTRCASRKVGCDRARPRCSRCARGNLTCQYATESASSSGPIVIIDETPTVISDQQSLSSRLDRLSQTVSNANEEARRSSGHATSNAVSTDEEDSGHLVLGAQTKSDYLSSTFFATVRQELSAIENIVRQQRRSAVQGHSPSSIQSMNTHARRHSAHIREEARDFRARLYGDIFPHVPFYSDRDDVPAYSPHGTSLEMLLSSLPSIEQQRVLISAYMQGYQSITPLFNGILFSQQVHEFHRWTEGLNPNFVVGTHFLALLTAVIFAGCVVCPRPKLLSSFGDATREALATRFYDLSISAIRFSGFPQSPSVNSLSAFILVDTTFLREEEPLTCCSFIGVAFRVAQMLGLHREPSHFPGLSDAEAQVRRQVWYTLVAIDAQVALASGLPPIIENRLYDVQPVKEVNDVLPPLSTVQRYMDNHILSIFVGGKYDFYQCTSEFLHVLHRNYLSEKDLNEILRISDKIEQEMEARQTRISEVERSPSLSLSGTGSHPEEAYHAGLSSSYAQFSKTVLSMLAAKPYAIMYGPLRRHNLLPLLLKRKPNAVAKCRLYLHRFIQLTQRQDFQPWHWCWPGQHQPLHSIMALITDLEDRPNDPLANETRKLVDLALCMCQESSGMVSTDDGDANGRPLHNGGSETWAFIRRARDHVWEAAGLDSTMLICPQSADEINLDSTMSSELPPLDSGGSPLDGQWLNPSQMNEDWAFLGQFTDLNTDPGRY